MWVKVGKKVYSGDVEPVMVILSEKDKENIANMDPKATKYCEYPDSVPKEEIEKFMKTVILWKEK